jgi:hypothetical protein
MQVKLGVTKNNIKVIISKSQADHESKGQDCKGTYVSTTSIMVFWLARLLQAWSQKKKDNEPHQTTMMILLPKKKMAK